MPLDLHFLRPSPSTLKCFCIVIVCYQMRHPHNAPRRPCLTPSLDAVEPAAPALENAGRAAGDMGGRKPGPRGLAMLERAKVVVVGGSKANYETMSAKEARLALVGDC